MSKNVAVFVDVANIFYAAKAAGVDIDYVTLLKSATAGRDFVRAYAYTGLDPDNENQRQFQSFLARNGFKVVTKDIRKYGDGKVKANLDIELVVDLMKTARNLDVAVVVSGDGDFAPAIRAVQETGVRVEVISFRGNTSSDLMEVADLFTDITQIAKVERGSVRSGRRVAASDDLSMTEVPDKETEGAAQRRRRTRGATREGAREGVREGARAERGARRPAARSTADVEEPVAPVGSLVVLPGEKLRRAVGAADAAVPDEASADAVAGGDASGGALEAGRVAVSDGDEQGAGDDGGRRRRRRGGRGRGRGRGGEVPELPERPVEEGLEDEEEEEIADLVAPPPARPTFGSVWDSQLGMPTAASGAAASADELEADLEEPEIPEYLLAERRRRGGRGRQPRGRGGHAPAYQQALDRERYGRSAMNAPATPAAPAPRRDRDRGPAGRGGRPGGPDRADRDRQRPPRDAVGPSRPSGGGDPWSEVPPEIEELLRAELSKQGAREAAPAGAGSRPAEAPAGAAAGETVAASRGRGRGGRGRGRGRELAGPAGDAGVVAPAGATSARDEAPPPAATATAAKPVARARRTAVRPRTSTGGAEPRGVEPGGVEPAAVAGPDPAPTSPPRAPRKPRASKTGAAAAAAGAAAGTDAGPSAGHAAAAAAAAKAPTKRAPRRRKAEPEG